jgi:hypothetical protein
MLKNNEATISVYAIGKQGSYMNVSTIARPRPRSAYEASTQRQHYENLFDRSSDDIQNLDSDADADGINTRFRLPYILSRKEHTVPSKTSLVPEPQRDASEIMNRKDNQSNPIIYRYFGRSRARSSRSDSISFIVLGPSADHWKVVGKILAARGFNVMVCERTKEQKIKSSENFTVKDADGQEHDVVEGEALTQAVLDALKWQKAILVGCDQEAVLAMEAALRLAPDRIAGLVLCGDLSSLQEHIEKQFSALNSSSDLMDEEVTVDTFLEDNVDCPCSIIWDGDASSWSTSNSEDLPSSMGVSRVKGSDGGNRNVIIGGGLAPHRRLPEQFAWTLTRFVENHVSPHSQDNGIGNELSAMEQLEQQVDNEINLSTSMTRKLHSGVWRDILPPRFTKAVDEVFAPGSLLVTGRVIATAIIYLSITRASLFQYHNIKDIRAALLNPTNLKNLLAIPGAFLRRRGQNQGQHKSKFSRTRTRTRVPKNLSLEEILPDHVDENDKLQAETFVDDVPNQLIPEEEEDLKEDADIVPLIPEPTDGDQDNNDSLVGPQEKKGPLSSPEPHSPFPIPKDTHQHPFSPTPDNEINKDFSFRDENNENNHLHEFMFFDQIVS